MLAFFPAAANSLNCCRMTNLTAIVLATLRLPSLRSSEGAAADAAWNDLEGREVAGDRVPQDDRRTSGHHDRSRGGRRHDVRRLEGQDLAVPGARRDELDRAGATSGDGS